jgi:alpha-mannosidase
LWWAAAIAASIDGTLVQEGDLFDQRCRLLVAEHAKPGQVYKFDLRLNAPTHDRGALHASTILIEYPDQPCDPGKLADELAVIAAYLSVIEQRSPEFLPLITTAVEKLEPSQPATS